MSKSRGDHFGFDDRDEEYHGDPTDDNLPVECDGCGKKAAAGVKGLPDGWQLMPEDPITGFHDIFCAECQENPPEIIDEGGEYDPYDDDDLIDGVGFADPGGRSALRAETPDNPRDQPCPNCGRENVLTRIDVTRRYQCDVCADNSERGVP